MKQQIYFNGPILTMNDQQKQAEAVLVCDGRIKALGSLHDVKAWQDEETTLIDLKGRTLMPSFIDGHSHLTAVALTLGLVDLAEAKNFAEIIALLKEFKAKRQPAKGEWIIGFNYDHNELAEKKAPTKAELDQVSTENPILISHTSGHMGVMNSLALQEVGITKATPDPEGGQIGRNADGEPNGYLEENAFITHSTKAPRPDLATLCGFLEEAQQIYLSYGITTVQDGMVGMGELYQLKTMAQEKRLCIDVVGYLNEREADQLAEPAKEYWKRYNNRFKIGGYKIFLDGSPQGRTAWLSKPYQDSDDYVGYPIYSLEQVTAFAKKAIDDDMQLLTHCNGDAAAEQLITGFADALAGKDGDYRPVMIHAQLVRHDQLAKMKALKMIPSFFVAHTYYWGDIHLANLGKERAMRISPAGEAQRLGLPFTFHQDSPVLAPDMLDTIWCAVNRQTKAGVSLDASEKVSVWEALKAVTINAAYQYFEENEKGSIAPNKLADFVVLSDNPLNMPVEAIRGIKVLATIKEGKCLYRAK